LQLKTPILGLGQEGKKRNVKNLFGYFLIIENPHCISLFGKHFPITYLFASSQKKKKKTTTH
jgi:hypothetical protein